MIEHMLKLTLLFHRSSRDVFLAELQRLGVFHIENYGVNQTPEIAAFEERIGRLAQIERYLRAAAGESLAPQERYDGDEEEFAASVDELRARIDRLEAERSTLEDERRRASRWGDFEPEKIRALTHAGYSMKLYSASKAAMDEIAAAIDKAEGSVFFEPVLEERGSVYFVVLYRKHDGEPRIDASEEPLPERGVATLDGEIARVQSEIDSTRGELAASARYCEHLASRVRTLSDELAIQLAHASLTGEAEGQVFVISGWVPHRQFPDVQRFLDAQEVIYMSAAPHHGENVPVLLKNRRYPRLFEPISKIFSLPSYGELDTTPFLAPFYTVFFGLCVADMGFGLVLIAVMIAALFILRRKSARPFILLGLVLGSSVFVAGLLLDDFFGLKVTETFGVHSPISRLVLFPDMYGQMYLAMMLGILQVGVGFIVRLVNGLREYGPVGAVNPAGSFLMLAGVTLAAVALIGGPTLAIGPIPAGRWISSIPSVVAVALALVAVGFVSVVFFAHPDRGMVSRLKHGMWQLYELMIGFLGDTLSYLRLFALGFAGGLLSGAIVNLGLLVKGDAWWGIFPMVLVLLLGSAINLAIGLLSAFVHSLRLTFVEFYKAVGFKGGGIEYRPFKTSNGDSIRA